VTSLPDDARVVRGGSCTAERFRSGSGVRVDEQGLLYGVSVNAAAGKSVPELSGMIPNRRVGVTTVGDIRAAGGAVKPAPNSRNADHCVMSGLTAEQAENLFTPIHRNPNVER
jgi:hypothetical protein